MAVHVFASGPVPVNLKKSIELMKAAYRDAERYLEEQNPTWLATLPRKATEETETQMDSSNPLLPQANTMTR